MFFSLLRIHLQKMHRFRYVHCRCAAFILPRDVYPAIFPCRAAVRSGVRRVARSMRRCCLFCIGVQDRNNSRYDPITETSRVIMICITMRCILRTGLGLPFLRPPLPHPHHPHHSRLLFHQQPWRPLTLHHQHPSAPPHSPHHNPHRQMQAGLVL